MLSGAGIVGGVPSEWDALNYAPRVRIPTLMLNGRYDSEVPLETAQLPLFALLGTPPEQNGTRHSNRSHVEDRGYGRRDSPVAGPLSGPVVR